MEKKLYPYSITLFDNGRATYTNGALEETIGANPSDLLYLLAFNGMVPNTLYIYSGENYVDSESISKAQSFIEWAHLRPMPSIFIVIDTLHEYCGFLLQYVGEDPVAIKGILDRAIGAHLKAHGFSKSIISEAHMEDRRLIYRIEGHIF